MQLKAEHKPISHMQKWQAKILPKWSDSADAAKEKPRLVFRRDARATLGQEKQASDVKWIPLCTGDATAPSAKAETRCGDCVGGCDCGGGGGRYDSLPGTFWRVSPPSYVRGHIASAFAFAATFTLTQNKKIAATNTAPSLPPLSYPRRSLAHRRAARSTGA